MPWASTQRWLRWPLVMISYSILLLFIKGLLFDLLTLIRVFETLRGLGYEGGYDVVRRYARTGSADGGRFVRSAGLEVYQSDWSHAIVFGIIKSVMGFRQLMLRGIDRVRGEWRLVTMAWNIKRMFILCPRQ